MTSITSVCNARAAGLTEDEKYWLTYMREEEKLARDVYLFLDDLWDSPVFANISESEQKHMDAIKTLLDRYGIPDPAAETEEWEGEFTNPDFRDLYNYLIGMGRGSLVAALQVGVMIEEMDIDDLFNHAIPSTTRRDIKTVYSNLLQGSYNHLKAFEFNLTSLEVTYEP